MGQSEEAPTSNVGASSPAPRKRGFAVRLSSVEDSLFTERRLSLIGYTFLAATIVSFTIRFFAGNWLIDKAGNIVFTDFFDWWVGSQVALNRNAAAVYDYSSFSAAQALVTKWRPQVEYFSYLYPPTMLLLFAPIARLPYVTGFFVWIGTTLCLYVIALYEILPSTTLIVLALLPLPVGKCIHGGDSAFLMAGLLGLSLILMSQRPYLSGICLGLLAYKPQFVLFFPIALVATKQWRIIAAATLSASLSAATAAIVFGSNVWLLYLRCLETLSPATLLPQNMEGLDQTVLGLMRDIGGSPLSAWLIHIGVASLVTAAACVIWTRPVPYSLKAAAFSIGVLITTPHMFAYDLTAVSVPAAFLIADALEHGFLPGERFVLAGCFMVLFLCFQLEIGPIVLLVLMGLVFRRVLVKRDEFQCSPVLPVIAG